MRQFYGFLEIREGPEQRYFSEVVIEAESWEEAKRAFAAWLALKAMEDVPDGDDRAALMDVELAAGVMGFRETHLLRVPRRRAVDLLYEAERRLNLLKARGGGE
ncbi:hypothetical protein [Thermococcus sp. ES12]|uniref:hypothetical protein n=1 Tax=Thermococcus sp. ES12 TaxID=1638246 RepID=UPI00143124BF|nr:hypothetical protein [Thermococcus sp. ES12]NJE75955.1 hypothetical protein [Thermococcus sp. ES12]